MENEQEQLEAARLAKSKAAKTMKKFGSVGGVGITRKSGVYAVKVNLQEQFETGETIPSEIDGVPLVVLTVGKVRKQARSKK